MEPSPLSQWLGSPYQVVLRNPEGERLTGILVDLIPEHHLTLEKVTVISTGQKLNRLDIIASNISDIISLTTTEPELVPEPIPAAPLTNPLTASLTVSPTIPPGSHGHVAFQDPAIVSMTRKPTIQRSNPHKAPSETVQTPTDELVFRSPDQTDTTKTTASHLSGLSHLTIQTPSTTIGVATTAPTIDTTEDDLQDLTPTAATARSGITLQARKKGKRGKRQIPGKAGDESAPASSARSVHQSNGWRQTPILQSTKSFQPFASLRKNQKRRADPSADSGWASEDVTDVQEAGDFDFEGSLAKFDKRTIFDEMREHDRIDEADRLVSHNRLPRPKPGTAAGKNLHYTENVLDTTPSAPKIAKETPGDFWRSEADDDVVNGAAETPSGREGSGRNSRLRGDSRISTSRRSQSRKASTSAIAGPSRVNSGPSPASSTLPGLYTLTSNRRIDMVTHLQMLVVENVASNELGMTEDLIAENAGRGVCEVAMRALEDPAVKLRAAASSPPATNTIVIVAGNNKSGARAISAARHLRNRNVNTLVCVVGIERERELLDEIRKQVRLFRSFGGSVYTKSELFEYLAHSANTLNPSPQVPVSLIIDALLGLTISFEELRKSDQATTYELMEWANRNEAFVMAIDIPSGIDPTTGRVNVIDGTKLYVQPRYIVALGAPKTGLLKALESADETGDIITADEWKLYLADIGLGPMVWRKAARIRRGIDFDENWVLQLRYHSRSEED
ncbi:YjeF-related protein N-terminus-domain-containing protein [Xylaria palmicola]|nr:YjeF-related protein N-terminus-domain-containing protein [Xylaria palmicola]